MGNKLVPFKKQGSTDPELNELLHALRRTQSEIGQAYNQSCAAMHILPGCEL